MGAWIYRIQILDIIKLHFPLRLKEKASYGNIVLVYFILLLFNLAFFYCTTHALESARQSIISFFLEKQAKGYNREHSTSNTTSE